MCIRSEEYNKIMQSDDVHAMVEFSEECENQCVKYGSCDYLGWLDDRIKEILERHGLSSNS